MLHRCFIYHDFHPLRALRMSDSRPIVQAVLEYTLNDLQQHTLLEIDDRLPNEYLATLSNTDKLDALRACLILHRMTSSAIVSRVFQLQASLALLNGKDTIVTAGTGCGKTLCQLIPMLLRPGSVSITISPLKRLQVTQVWSCGQTFFKSDVIAFVHQV